MSYIEDTLTANEVVKLEAKVTWRSFAFALVFYTFMIPFFGIGLIGYLRVWLIIKSNEFAVTDKRVIAKRGIISRKTCEINLKKIESIQVDQGVFGRLLGYGTLAISGTGVTTAYIPDIDNPMMVRSRLQDIVEQAQKQHS